MKEFIIDRLRALYPCYKGIVYLLCTQAFQLHVIMGCIILTLSCIYLCTLEEWMYVFLAYLVLLSAEAFNTSIEKLADYASAYKRHHLIGKVKDMAAAATLFIGVGVLVVWVYIFLPHIIS